MNARSGLKFVSVILTLCISMPSRALARPEETELRAFRETVERYAQRMAEFEEDVTQIVDLTEKEEAARIEESFGAAKLRAEEEASTLRRVMIVKLEAFLQRHPSTRYAADMKFRLADLYYDESEVEFSLRVAEYDRLDSSQGEASEMAAQDEPKKDYRKSIEVYNDILASHPDFEYRPDTYYMLGWCHMSGNAMQLDEAAARDAYLAIVTRYPKSAFANDANMRLGEYYFELPGTRSELLANLRTAIEYYNAVLADGPTGQNYDEAIYKLGWSHYKLNEYERALAYLVQLLDYSDALYQRKGVVADTRKEAVEYLAISYADMANRQGEQPVDIARAHFAKVGERPWRHDVIERLASILRTGARFEESVATYRFLQEQWPLDPQNPIYQNTISEIYSKMPIPDEEAAGAALEELGKMYTEGTSWYEANKNNPDAIAQARGYIEKSLATVATDQLIRCQDSGDIPTCQLAAATFRDFLQKYPFAADYDENEWLLAYAWFSAGEFANAARQYAQVLKNPHSKFRDGARLQLMKSREQIVLAMYGKLEDVVPGALVANTVTTPFQKQVVQYMISDEQVAFVAATDDLADREFSDPELILKLEQGRARMTYLGAVISFNHGYYDDARKRLWSVVNRYPGSPEAAFATDLIQQTYTNEGDLGQLLAVATKFGDMDIAGEVTLEICLAMSNAGNHLDSAACFGKFLVDFPKSKHAAEALYNQANQLDLGGQTGQANALFEKYINVYPTDERSKSLYFRIASGYSSILELDKAIKYFEALVRLAPDNVDAPPALFNAAFLRTGVGDHRGAAIAYERYAKLPNVPDVELIYWKAGEQWELVDASQAIAFYDRYLREFNGERTGFNPSHAIVALYKLSELHLGKGDKRKAALKLEELDAIFRENRGGSVTPDARKLAALAPTRALLEELELVKAVKWSGSEAVNAKIVVEQKPAATRNLEKNSREVIHTYQDFDASAAALYVQGAAWFSYSDIVFAYPTPPSISASEKQAYEDFVAERFGPQQIRAEETARTALLKGLEKARVEKRWSVWNSKSVELLNARFPADFPSERQETRGAFTETLIEVAGPASPKAGGAQ